MRFNHLLSIRDQLQVDGENITKMYVIPAWTDFRDFINNVSYLYVILIINSYCVNVNINPFCFVPSTFLPLRLLQVYLPNTRPGYGAGSLQGGLDYYKEALKWYLTVDMTPDQVHELGLQEVDRITKLMENVRERENMA